MRHLTLLAALTLALPATGTTLLDSEGFESPSYTAGVLEGQEGWLRLGDASSTATVQSAVSETGSQAVRIDRAANSNGYWANLIGSAPSGRFVSIDWDMRVEPIANPGQAFGPYFGVMVFDDSNGPVNQLAGFGVDAASEEIIYQRGGTGVIQAVGVATLGVWNHYRIEIDFENDRYAGYVNGSIVAEDAFIDSGIDRLTDADLVAVTAAGDAASQAITGTAYFDNYLVREGLFRDGLPGDYNRDGVVDAADYTVWRDSNGATGLGLLADGDGDAEVDSDDYDLWVTNYGMTDASPVAVPEPATASCLAALFVLVLATKPKGESL